MSSKKDSHMQIIKKDSLTSSNGQYNCIQTLQSMKPSDFSSPSSDLSSTSESADIPSGYAKLNDDESLAMSILNPKSQHRKYNCKAKRCNLVCCGYICCFILILIASLWLMIYSLIHEIYTPHFNAVYVQLFSYNGFTENLAPIIYVNGTGQLITEIKNNMNINAYIHDVEFDIMATNIVGNKEQIGNAKCCEYDLKWNASHPFNTSVPYKFDKEVHVPSKQRTNVTMLFSMPGLSEEIWDVYITKQMIPQNGFEIELMMKGYGSIKKWGFDVKVFVDCEIKANASRFVLSQTNDNGLLRNIWPPQLYYYQTFPILNSNCTYSLTI